MTKKRVLLTGASGSMGGETFKELLKRRDKYDIVLLLRPSADNKKNFSRYEEQKGVRIVWGDLCNFDDVLRAVDGADHILHPAAMIAPAADNNPALCRKCNLGGTENLIAAIKRQPDNGDGIRFINICSVAVYGDRLPPIHMVRVGDPLKPSVGDYYTITKMAAERAVIESGLKYWASIRPTYIAKSDALSLMDPILFHQPVNTNIELITSEDAGYGLVQTVEAPDDFYGRVYNMGGGPSCRVVFKEYLQRMYQGFGLGDYRKIMPRNWFALRNFHCCWYEDSWVLNEYIGHWRHTLEDHYRQVEEAIPSIISWGSKIAPPFIVKAYLKRMADPLKWIENNETEKIKAFFGSREAWENIPGWDHDIEAEGGDEFFREDYAALDVGALAGLRGGQCLSTGSGDDGCKLRFRCGFGHEWEGTATLIRAGHWCPECAAPPWNYDEIARVDTLLARFYYNNHDKDEHQIVDYLWCPNE